VRRHQSQGSLEVARLADDVQVLLAVQQQPEAAPQRWMIVRQNDPDRAGMRSIRVHAAVDGMQMPPHGQHATPAVARIYG
jgi:hypothetical protein